ncbi:MAG: hypothetical protein MUO21_09840, partial [Nitrososphaeraceae archaeon]|nr:hypothetical protein [Nitrososphaeraceae archaeon]
FPYEYSVIPKINLLHYLAELKYPYDDCYKTCYHNQDTPWKKIEILLKKHYKQGLKPDQKLLELLSKNKMAITTINHLMKKYDVNPTLQSIINMAKANEESFMVLLLEKYKDNKKNKEENQDLTELCNLIKNEGTLIKIKEYITNNNIKPNVKALEIACMKKNKKLAEYLINEHNVIPNGTCIKTITTHTKTKFTGSMLEFYDFYEFNDNEIIDDQVLKETKDSIVPTKYTSRERTLYFCRLNNPLDKFQSIKDDFQVMNDEPSSAHTSKNYPNINISVDKNGNITQVKYKNNPKLTQTHILICITIEILYNIETLAANKKILLNIMTEHYLLMANSYRYVPSKRDIGGHKIYVQTGRYPFGKEYLGNYRCYIKDYSFEQYVKHLTKDEKKEQVKAVKVDPFYLTMDTFKSKLVPILGDKIKIDSQITYEY